MRKSKQFATIALVVLAMAGSAFALGGRTTSWSWSIPGQKGVLTYSTMIITNSALNGCTNDTLKVTGAATFDGAVTVAGSFTSTNLTSTTAGVAASWNVGTTLVVSNGATVASLVIDEDGLGIDTAGAGDLNIGTNTANAINIGKTTEIVTLLGPVVCDETLGATGIFTATANIVANGDIVGDASTIATNFAVVNALSFQSGANVGITQIYTNIGMGSTNIVTVTDGLITAITAVP